MTTYYAVPDPNDASVMTYWRRDKRGQLQPWPERARYGPHLTRADLPLELHGRHRDEWAASWMREVRAPWMSEVQRVIDDRPDEAAGRFAVFATRCCMCGRVLTDPASKTYGIGPECRSGLSDEQLAAMAEHVGQLHGEAVK